MFGVVLQTRFGADRSSTGFALYFLAGMLPWLAFSEPAGRAPFVVVEHRNFVKKLIFPLDTLPVNQVVAGLVTELFAAAVFVVALLLIRGSIPLSVLWLPVLPDPAVAVHAGSLLVSRGAGRLRARPRPDHGLRADVVVLHHAHLLSRTDHAAGVRHGDSPKESDFRSGARLSRHSARTSRAGVASVGKVWLVAMVVFLLGYAWFYKLRKSFADMI